MAQPVPFSSFPKFLDEESDHFLLTMAKIDMEIDELSQKLKKHREKIFLTFEKIGRVQPSNN